MRLADALVTFVVNVTILASCFVTMAVTTDVLIIQMSVYFKALD